VKVYLLSLTMLNNSQQGGTPISVASSNWCNRLKKKLIAKNIFIEYPIFYKKNLSFKKNLIRYFWFVITRKYNGNDQYCFYGFSITNILGLIISNYKGCKTYFIVPDVWDKYQKIFPFVIKFIKRKNIKIGFLSYKLAIDFNSYCLPGVINFDENNKHLLQKDKVVSMMANGSHNDYKRVLNLFNNINTHLLEKYISLTTDTINKEGLDKYDCHKVEWVDAHILNRSLIGISFYSKLLKGDVYNFPSKILEYFDRYTFVLSDKKIQIDPILHPMCEFSENNNSDLYAFNNLVLKSKEVDIKVFRKASKELTERLVSFFKD
jgi:hypothetical protein